ncbi:hypothetical protein [Inconstantimicrobium porci]|uniref:Uncharacterized protein n=1 Tax=Inconstantimicrobium porci TaxID=2652291 RepID=A0A7X2T2A5_9CLOT|nr:hypothetical protein [Inconstantimicrobium porci]MSR92444.1 hypothetical protein [Inconstantimicrobium porci]
MSEILDNMGKIVKKSGKDAVKKTKDMTEIIKIKKQIIEEERNVKKCCEELGRTYYKIYGGKPADELQKLCSNIFLAEGNIKHLKKEMMSIKSKK